jgi:ubiquinone/menaquinone biosynthesis C-methylase UbiE
MQDPNPFEDPTVAREWIASIEAEAGTSRDEEIYPFLYEWSKSPPSKTIVEIGSGQGACSSKLDFSSDNRYIGIEPSEILLTRARELYPEPNKTFLKGTAYSTGLDDASVDAVFGVGVWFHLEDLDAAHNEIGRILKSEGRLLIFTSNPEAIGLWESWFIEPRREGKRIEGKVVVPKGTLTNNILYIHTKEELVDSLSRNGFQIISIKEIGFGANNKREKGAWIMIEAVKI